MQKIIRKKIVKFSTIIMIVLLLAVMVLIPIGTSYAGSWVAGTMNYAGTINECKYNIVVYADLASDHRYSSSGFHVKAEGVSCKRNIWTSFTYDILFSLVKNYTLEGGTYPLNFKITKAELVGEKIFNPIMFESSVLSGPGEYTLAWSGEIRSNSTEKIEGYYEFSIM